jgi:nitric oxide reductase subunit C
VGWDAILCHPMPSETRRILLITLVGIFLAQTWLIYSDPAGRSAPPLSESAARGSRVWHRHNCQACHQIYGFGGFLGPDVTNVASRLGEADGSAADLAARLETVLTTGSERMPAFHLDADDRLALATFFMELAATGVGQVVVSEAKAPREVFDDVVRSVAASAAALSPLEAEGQRVMRERGCIDCHLPNAKSTFKSTDLTRIHGSVETARVTSILTDGLPAKGMPRFALPPAEIEAVAAFLALLELHGAEIRLGFETAEKSSSGSLLDLPWFEYP